MIFIEISSCSLRKYGYEFAYTGCDRYTSYILNCHLCGAWESRQVVMVALSSKYHTILFPDVISYDYGLDRCTPWC